MVEGILAFFLGGAVAGAVIGITLYISSGELASLLMPAVLAIALLANGFIPFVLFAAAVRNVWSTARLKRVGFITGLLLVPGLFGLESALEVSGLPLEACTGPWKPICKVGSSFVVVALIVASC